MKRFGIAILAVLLTACSAPGPTLDGRWIVTDMVDYKSLRNHTPWMEFKAGKVHGHSGCNAFVGTYEIIKGELVFDSIGTAQKICYGPEVKQESALLNLLNRNLMINKDNGNLELYINELKAITLSPELPTE